MVLHLIGEHLVTSLQLLVNKEARCHSTVILDKSKFLADPVLLVLQIAEELTHPLLLEKAVASVSHWSLKLHETDTHLLMNLLKLILSIGVLLLQLFGMIL